MKYAVIGAGGMGIQYGVLSYGERNQSVQEGR